jgi:hypothetical protein
MSRPAIERSKESNTAGVCIEASEFRSTGKKLRLPVLSVLIHDGPDYVEMPRNYVAGGLIAVRQKLSVRLE